MSCDASPTQTAEAVTISYKDLVSGTCLDNEIREAFGPNGLGLILIKDYPDFGGKRARVLWEIRKFAGLPEAAKEKYARPDCHYGMGWSHGKEKMKSGIPDTAKGSFYARPHGDVITDDEELKARYPATYGDNVWPRKECPGLENSFKEMTAVQMEVGLLMCGLFDSYLFRETKGTHPPGSFQAMVEGSVAYKGRMLHYFPVEPRVNRTMDGLCGWHLDHGCVTCLLSPLYLDLAGNTLPKPDQCGLYVKSPRDGSLNQVDIPADCLAIQLGETFQILSGGLLRATPHCVRASTNPQLTREQLVLFMDCRPEEPLVLPEYSLPREEVLETPFLPEGVPLLTDRLRGANCYREFMDNTLKAYL